MLEKGRGKKKNSRGPFGGAFRGEGKPCSGLSPSKKTEMDSSYPPSTWGALHRHFSGATTKVYLGAGPLHKGRLASWRDLPAGGGRNANLAYAVGQGKKQPPPGETERG